MRNNIGVNPILTGWLFVTAIGLTIVLFGICQEAHGQVNLLRTNIAAYNTYMDIISIKWDFGFFEYISLGLQLKLPSFGGNTQAYGFAVILAAPVAAFLHLVLPHVHHMLLESELHHQHK